MVNNRNLKLWQSIDWITILIYTALVIAGWVNIYAAVYNEEHTSIFDISQKYGRQMIWILAAIFLIIIIMLIDSRFYMYFSYPIYLISLLLMISVLFFGIEVNGARAWFDFGGIRMQPSEMAKFATVLAISNYLSQYGIKLLSVKSMLIVGVMVIVPAAIILMQNDTGTAVLFASLIILLFREGLPFYILLILMFSIILFIMVLTQDFYLVLITIIVISYLYGLYRNNFKKQVLYFGAISLAAIIIAVTVRQLVGFTFDLMWIFIIYLIIIIPAILYYSFMNKSPQTIGIYSVAIFLAIFSYSSDYLYDNVLQQHQRDRIDLIMGINVDPLGAGYNVNQSKIAIGSGGLTGKGFLQGTQTKYDFVPEQSTDFIFCTIGEEWGFFGSTVVVLLFLFLLLRLIFLAERQPLKFSRLFGYGVISFIFAHVFINVGMTIGIAPVIGIPLPFFSYGGSSLWAFTILLFVFIRLDADRGMYVNK